MIERRGLDWGGKKRVLSPGKEADGGENLTGGARLGPMDHHRAKRGHGERGDDDELTTANYGSEEWTKVAGGEQ